MWSLAPPALLAWAHTVILASFLGQHGQVLTGLQSKGFSGGQRGVTKHGLDTKPEDMGFTELSHAGHVT